MKIFILLILLSISIDVHAKEIGKIKNVNGNAHITRNGTDIKIYKGFHLEESDIIITKQHSSIGIIFTDNSIMSIGPSSKVMLVYYDFNVENKTYGMITKIYKGTLIYLSGFIAKVSPDAIKFKTPASVAGIKGTKIAISVDRSI